MLSHSKDDHLFKNFTGFLPAGNRLHATVIVGLWLSVTSLEKRFIAMKMQCRVAINAERQNVFLPTLYISRTILTNFIWLAETLDGCKSNVFMKAVALRANKPNSKTRFKLNDIADTHR